MNDVRYGILDPCVFIDVDKIEASTLPDESYVTTISLAELAAGPHAAQDPNERAQRQDRLQSVETNFEALPFDASAARAYGRVYALELAGGRKPVVRERWISSSQLLPSPRISLSIREILKTSRALQAS